MFAAASCTSDWHMPYKLLVPTVAGWDLDKDEVVIGMSPDYACWDDYGFRSRSMPPYGNANSSYPTFWQASSDDGTGIVTLADPNLIDILVPYTAMRQMGPGGVNVEIQYRGKDNGSRATLLLGRLPLQGGQF
jgi:hypothetical protein